jgi:hypothetical protein
VSDDATDELYALPLEEFTAARNALAKTEPSAKDLKKPSRAAWTVNQLARERRGDVKALVDAGRRLRKAQASGRDMAAATADERKALDRLLDAAREHGATTDAVVSGVRSTLQAAAADDEAAERVLEGRLEKELDAPGFGPLLTAAAAVPQRAKPKQVPKRDRAREEAERRRARAAQAALREAERAEAAARREWEKAKSALERARAAAG